MTETFIQRQLANEQECRAIARQRLRDSTQTAENRRYCSDTVYGRTFIKAALEDIGEAIGKRLPTADNGYSSGSEFGADIVLIREMPIDVVALITAKVVMDYSKLVFPKNTLQFIVSSIGEKIYDEYLLTKFKAKHPKEFADVRKYQNHNKGYSYKVQDYRAKMRKVDYDAPKWVNSSKLRIGMWLFRVLAESTGWVKTETRRQGKKTHSVVVTSQEFNEARTALLEQASERVFMAWPMLCAPLSWSTQERGGYLDSTLRQRHSLIRTRRGPTLVPGELEGTPALRMLNRLQRTEYQVNRLILEVGKECHERRISIGKFRAYEPLEPPTRPEGATEEEYFDWRKKCTEVHDFNHSIPQKNYTTTELLEVGKRYVDQESYWLPWSFDYRGRAYPLSTSLQPQGTDFEKSLINFTEPGPINEYWLSFQVATTFSKELSKSSMSRRQEWSRENHELISRVANDPMANLSLWSDAEEPWLFLAACNEFNSCVIEKSQAWSNLPIGVDATCSGLQHLAGLTYDLSAARMVNVAPNEEPASAYDVVCQEACKHLPPEYHPLMTKDVVKRTVMCTPYGITQSSARGYIRDKLPKTFPDGSPVDLALVTKAVFKHAIPAVIPGPIGAMKFIQQAAVDRVKALGGTSIRWTTPSGFFVIQDLRKSEATRIETKLLGARLTYILRQEIEEPDIPHHRSSSAPNLIHSMDATLFHLTGAGIDYPFTTVHDCIYTRSCDMDKTVESLRRNYVEMYRQPILKGWADQLEAPFDVSLDQGTLNIEDALKSNYLFC